MSAPIIHDYAAVARALKDLHNGTTKADLIECEIVVCPACEGGGWIGYFGPQGTGPNFRECNRCWNPEGIPRP